MGKHARRADSRWHGSHPLRGCANPRRFVWITFFAGAFLLRVEDTAMQSCLEEDPCDRKGKTDCRLGKVLS